MKKGLIWLISILLMGIVSCKKSETPIVTVLEIFPLKIGNNWQFQTTLFDTIVTFHVNTVVKDTMLSTNNSWFVLTYDTNTRLVCKNRPDGCWFWVTNPVFPQGIEVLYYRYPANVSDRYQTTDGIVVLVAGINVTVTVPAGTFGCYQYNTTYPSGDMYMEYYAPGIGLVRLDRYILSNGIKNIIESTELISYTLK